MSDVIKETPSPSELRGPAPTAPADALLVVPVRGFVLFPGAVMPLTIGRPRSVAAAQQAVREGRQIGVVLQRDPEAPDPSPTDLHAIGVIANVLRFVTGPNGVHHLICQGQDRFRAGEYILETPYLACRFERIAETDAQSAEIEARFLNLKSQAEEILQLTPQSPPELLSEVQQATSPSALADLVAAYMDATPEEKQSVLETLNLNDRITRVSALLAHRLQVLRLSREIGLQTKASLDERQRKMLLREQLLAIQRELGEGEEGGKEADEIAARITKANMPSDVEDAARKELRRLERTPEAAAEHGMIRTYLDWLIGAASGRLLGRSINQSR